MKPLAYGTLRRHPTERRTPVANGNAAAAPGRLVGHSGVRPMRALQGRPGRNTDGGGAPMGTEARFFLFFAPLIAAVPHEVVSELPPQRCGGVPCAAVTRRARARWWCSAEIAHRAHQRCGLAGLISPIDAQHGCAGCRRQRALETHDGDGENGTSTVRAAFSSSGTQLRNLRKNGPRSLPQRR